MASSSSSSDEQHQKKNDDSSSSKEPEAAVEDVVVLHKTKTIQFKGRTTPIVLQNSNGPCPLIAICNVLLLRNQLNLNADITEVSQEKLLSLVAERLLDSNSNNKDANQQQNVHDAIDLLPQLTTGIDVNIKFRRINDFEFTRESAIFHLLDIPLYHGWLVDPQDHDTFDAIGIKSYNAITAELVSLETRKMENEGKDKVDEDCVDFAAATAATLGVPSPSLSRAKSLDDSPRSISDQHCPRKGDVEEEAQLLKVLKLSQEETPTNFATASPEHVSLSSGGNSHMMKSTLPDHVNVTEETNLGGVSSLEPSVSGSTVVSGDCERHLPLEDHAASFTVRDNQRRNDDQLFSLQPFGGSLSNDLATCAIDAPSPCGATLPLSPVEAPVPGLKNESVSSPVSCFPEELYKPNGDLNETPVAGLAGSESSSGRIPSIEAVESFTSSLDGSEPIYEGEECILNSVKLPCGDREPVYEGEVVLAEQADKGTGDASDGSPKGVLTLRQGELIDNFLKSNASQLTIYGLFCLQEGLGDNELCVFFRNNHFSTMFKFDGQLYLLATDQGYMNQPDLVWERLNEVNGDTLFVNSNFKEFRLESSTNGTWDQQNAVTSTADYLASIDSSSPDGTNLNSDLQLAIALQQQEFDEQQQQQPQRNPSQQQQQQQQQSQVPRSSGKATSSTSKQDHKSKDKSSSCKLM